MDGLSVADGAVKRTSRIRLRRFPDKLRIAQRRSGNQRNVRSRWPILREDFFLDPVIAVLSTLVRGTGREVSR